MWFLKIFPTDSLINMVSFTGRSILCVNRTFLQQNVTLKKVNSNKTKK